MMKKISGLLAMALWGLLSLQAEGIVTASDFFAQVSGRYAALDDYQARISITQGRATMSGIVYYKNPNRIRIDFDDPSGQVLNTDGKTLTIYIPRFAMSFTQELRKSATGAVALTSKQGLYLMRQAYSIAYETGPDPSDLEGTKEKVTKLRLTWREANQAFRQLDIAVGSNGLIRRITGFTVNNYTITFDLSNIRTNVGIPEKKFDFPVPPQSNKVTNFLFEP